MPMELNNLRQLPATCLQERQLRPLRVQNGREPGDTSGGEQLGPLHMLLFGALSGASAEAVVYPMEVIRRRMQVQAASAGSAGELLPAALCDVFQIKAASVTGSICGPC